MRTPKTWTAVGVLCRGHAEALSKLEQFRADPATSGNDWGLVKIKVPTGDTPAQVGKIHLPPPPALLKRLEGLLAEPEIRRTTAGREALELVREALRKKKRRM